jgi:nucleotide-binding universal stress UspA family protein
MKILLATDGSRSALEAATALARWFPRPGAEVDLLAVVPNVRKSTHRRYGQAPEQTREWRGVAHLWVDDTARRLESRGFAVQRLVRSGHAAEVVVARSRARAYDLVVVGAKGRGASPFFAVGSVALAVIEHAPGPVLAVRAGGPGRAGEPTALHPLRIVLAYDGSPGADRALERFGHLFGGSPAEVAVLTVAGGERTERQARISARGAAARLRDMGLQAEARTAAGEATRRILEAAENADLLVLGTRDVSETGERRLGSVSLTVARETPCSILVVRPGPGSATAGAGAVAGPESFPFDVAYRDVEASPSVEHQVLQGLRRLERIEPDLVRAHIVLARRSAVERKGALYEVTIRITVPGHEVVVSRIPPGHREAEGLETAIGEAFDKARRALVDHRVREEDEAHHPAMTP